ncbi:MAG: Carbamoyltransferase, partial [Methylococcaceae bacterium NSP1-2]
MAGLSRWDQKPYVDTLFHYMANVAKQEPDIKKFYWNQQPARITRLFKQRQKPAGVLAEKPTQTVEHHLAHAASAYYASPFADERVGVISLDGVGDFSWGSVWLGEHGELQKVEHLLGFKATRHEGKVLGLAAFGNPEPLLSRLLAHTNQTDWTNLFDAKLARIVLQFAKEVGQSALRELCEGLSQEDVAAGIQAYTEQLICAWVQEQAQKLQFSKLALAGGVFANVKLNQR